MSVRVYIRPRFEGPTLRTQDSGGLKGPQIQTSGVSDVSSPCSAPLEKYWFRGKSILGFERRTGLLIMLLVEQVNDPF